MTSPEDDFAILPKTLTFRSIAQIVLLGLAGFASCHKSAIADSSQPGQNNHAPYALIFGTVWGPDSQPVYGVQVKIRRANEKQPRWVLYSDHHGEFAQRVPAEPADYRVSADLHGYKPNKGKRLQPGEEVTVHVEHDERVDTGLHLK